MRHLLITAAAVTAFVASLASTPASAIDNYGPTKAGNQCFTPGHSQGRDLGFGAWGACPQTASAPVTRTASRRPHR